MALGENQKYSPDSNSPNPQLSTEMSIKERISSTSCYIFIISLSIK